MICSSRLVKIAAKSPAFSIIGPAVILILVSSFILLFVSRYPPYYIPAALILGLAVPLNILRPGKKQFFWFYVRLEIFINFMSGLITSLIIPLFFLIPKIGVSTSLTYWGKTLWIIIHPWIIYKASRASTSLEYGLNEARGFIVPYILSYFWLVGFLAFFLIFCKRQAKERCILFILIALAWATLNSLRGHANSHYVIYMDVFWIFAMIMAFSGIQKYFAERLSLNKHLLEYGVVLIFAAFIGISGIAEFDRLKENYKIARLDPVHYPMENWRTFPGINRKIYSDSGWYVKRYDKAMERAYKNLQGFLDRGDKFLRDDENNYVKYNWNGTQNVDQN